MMNFFVKMRQRRIDPIEWIGFCKAFKMTPEEFLEELAFVLRRK